MSTRVGRYPSPETFGIDQCVVEENEFYRLGYSSDNTISGIVTDIGEVTRNGLIQVKLQGLAPAVAYENCWVDKYGYIFSRANIPVEQTVEELKIEPVKLKERVQSLFFNAKRWVEFPKWHAINYALTFKVMYYMDGMVLGDIEIKEGMLCFGGLSVPVPVGEPVEVSVVKSGRLLTIKVGDKAVSGHGITFDADMIGRGFDGYIFDVSMEDLDRPFRSRYYGLYEHPDQTIPEGILGAHGVLRGVLEGAYGDCPWCEEEEPMIPLEPAEPVVVREPKEAVLVSNLRFISGGLNPWVELGDGYDL